jgi:hypothetical protein
MSDSVAILKRPTAFLPRLIPTLKMIKVTDEIREAARRLLAKHNANEAARVQALYEAELRRAEEYVKYYGKGVPNKPLIWKIAAREIATDKDKRKLLEAIVDGKRKLIDGSLWQKISGDVYRAGDRAKLEKIAAMADPARNSSEHERQEAAAKLTEAETRHARRAPGMRPEPPPLPTDPADWGRRYRKTKTPKANSRPSPQPSHKYISDSVAARDVSDSVAAVPVSVAMSGSVAPPAHAFDKLKALNEQRAARRAEKRAGLKCQTCGKPLAARRATARYCSVTCRSRAWRT